MPLPVRTGCRSPLTPRSHEEATGWKVCPFAPSGLTTGSSPCRGQRDAQPRATTPHSMPSTAQSVLNVVCRQRQPTTRHAVLNALRQEMFSPDKHAIGSVHGRPVASRRRRSRTYDDWPQPQSARTPSRVHSHACGFWRSTQHICQCLWWCLELQGLSWSFVDFLSDGVEVGLGQGLEVKAVWAGPAGSRGRGTAARSHAARACPVVVRATCGLLSILPCAFDIRV